MLLFFVMEKGGVSYPDIKQENDEVDIKMLCKLSEQWRQYDRRRHPKPKKIY